MAIGTCCPHLHHQACNCRAFIFIIILLLLLLLLLLLTLHCLLQLLLIVGSRARAARRLAQVQQAPEVLKHCSSPVHAELPLQP